jgi:hypothetical protein
MAASEGSIKTLLEKSQDYLETKIEIAKLKTIGKSSDALSTIVVLISVIILSILFFMFVSIGLALWIGWLLGSAYSGFFIMAGVYFVAVILLYVFREQWIRTPVTNLIIKKLLK